MLLRANSLHHVFKGNNVGWRTPIILATNDPPKTLFIILGRMLEHILSCREGHCLCQRLGESGYISLVSRCVQRARHAKVDGRCKGVWAYDCSFGLKPFLSKELTQRRSISAGARLRSRRNLIGRHDNNDKGETSKTEGQGRLIHWQPMLWHWIADAGWTQLHVIKPTIRADVMPSWRIVAGGETSHNSRRLCIRLIPDLRFLPMCSVSSHKHAPPRPHHHHAMV